MWGFIVGIFAGRGLANTARPDSVKQARWDARTERRERKKAVRASWGPTQWIIAVVVAVVVVVLLNR